MCVAIILQFSVVVFVLGGLHAYTSCDFGNFINKTSANTSLTIIDVENSEEIQLEHEGTYTVNDRCAKFNNNSCECTLAKCYFSNIICQCIRFTIEECREKWFHTSCRKRNVFYAKMRDLCFNAEAEGICKREIIRYANIQVGNYELVLPNLASKRLQINETQKGNDQCYMFESFIGNGTFEACIKISKLEISSTINKIISLYIHDVQAVHPVDISTLISLAMDHVEICVQFTVVINGEEGKLTIPGNEISSFKISEKRPYFYYNLCGAGEKCEIPENKRGKPFEVQLIVSRLFE